MAPKKTLRRITRDKRDSLCCEDREQMAQAIKDNLFAQPEFKSAEAVLFYAAFGSEVPTYSMIEESLEIGKMAILPITDIETNSLLLRRVHDLSSLKPSKYGIPEPELDTTEHFEMENIDLILVPGMVFDECGNRIGYGGGYYDRFLSKINASVPWVSIAFELQIVPLIPKEKHDLPVDKIITEKRIIDTHEARLRRMESIWGY